jgi:hypothetical protein
VPRIGVDRVSTLERGGVSVLVGGTVFKTVVAEDLGQGGSIPLRLRHLQECGFGGWLKRLPAPAR